jgi:hypothetical protein
MTITAGPVAPVSTGAGAYSRRTRTARLSGEIGGRGSTAGLVTGNPGWASTGASTTGSSAMESAKPPALSR